MRIMGDTRGPGHNWLTKAWVSKRSRILLMAVLILALAAEQVYFLRGSTAQSAATPVVPAGAGVPGQLRALAMNALGPSDRGARRSSLTATSDKRHRYAVVMTWAINGDLSMGSVSDGAELEAYLTLRAFYSSGLPLSSVRMTGTFADRAPGGGTQEVPVLSIGLDQNVARQISWSAVDAGSLWPLLRHYMERPGFACNCQS
jgi:hypothetical protein